MNPFFEAFIISLSASIVAIMLTLFIEKKRLPKLDILAIETANSDNIYSSGQHVNERWKFFRVKVINKRFPKIFSWIPRQTAENCRAKIEIHKINPKKTGFSFQGRWASTPELPHIQDAFVKLQHPEPVTIPIGFDEKLDIITKAQKDDCAYGWNNEAYFNNWRTQKYKLEVGNYKVKIAITTQNGVSFTKIFKLVIGNTIEETFLN